MFVKKADKNIQRIKFAKIILMKIIFLQTAYAIFDVKVNVDAYKFFWKTLFSMYQVSTFSHSFVLYSNDSFKKKGRDSFMTIPYFSLICETWLQLNTFFHVNVSSWTLRALQSWLMNRFSKWRLFSCLLFFWYGWLAKILGVKNKIVSTKNSWHVIVKSLNDRHKFSLVQMAIDASIKTITLTLLGLYIVLCGRIIGLYCGVSEFINVYAAKSKIKKNLPTMQAWIE